MNNNCDIFADKAEDYINAQGFMYHPGIKFGIGDFEDHNAKSWDESKTIQELLWRVRGLMRNTNPRDEVTLSSAIMYEVSPYVVATEQKNKFKYYFKLVYKRYFEDLEDGLY